MGTLLLEHLVSVARTHGIRAFTAEALTDNHEMLKVFADLGMPRPDEQAVHGMADTWLRRP
ncbi:hypothetical protein ACIPIU_03650 [Streptomyces massasporeus]|uniref:hypothetical protein n=1 Tax=Streptomyces massasporeus TaxID=67324 RepID=UPI0036E92F2F